MDENILNFNDICRIISRRIRMIVAVTILCVMLGFAISSIQQKKVAVVQTKQEFYKSTASILIGTFPDAGSNNIKDITILNQQIVKTYGAVAGSRTVVDKVIKDLDLKVKTETFMNLTRVTASPDTQVVTLVYADKESNNVQKIVDTYVKEFLVQAQKIYPNAKLTVLDEPSKAEKMTKDEFDKMGLIQDQAQQNQVNSESKVKSRKLVLAVAFLLGIMVSMGIAFILDYKDKSIKKREDAEKIFDIPVIGLIDNKGKSKEATIDENYKIMRTNLQYKSNITLRNTKETLISNSNKAFIVTSPSEKDGKTTTALNLGIAFSEAGFKTLLIDANGRSPELSNALNIKKDRGLSELLNEEFNVGKKVVDNKENIDIYQYISQTDKSNLYLLGWGSMQLNPADIFAKSNISRVIENLKDRFDYIIIDAPSLVKYADGQIMSKAVDGVILAIEEYKTSRSEALRAKQLIQISKMEIIGMVWRGNKL